MPWTKPKTIEKLRSERDGLQAELGSAIARGAPHPVTDALGARIDRLDAEIQTEQRRLDAEARQQAEREAAEQAERKRQEAEAERQAEIERGAEFLKVKYLELQESVATCDFHQAAVLLGLFVPPQLFGQDRSLDDLMDELLSRLPEAEEPLRLEDVPWYGDAAGVGHRVFRAPADEPEGQALAEAAQLFSFRRRQLRAAYKPPERVQGPTTADALAEWQALPEEEKQRRLAAQRRQYERNASPALPYTPSPWTGTLGGPHSH